MELLTEKQKTYMSKIPSVYSEDTPRTSFIVHEHVHDFATVSEAHAAQIHSIYRRVLTTVPYNSFLQICKLLKSYEDAMLKDNHTDILEIFNNLDFAFSEETLRTCGGSCVEIAMHIKSQLQLVTINSYITPYKAGGAINQAGNAYMGLRHVAIIIPSQVGERPAFILLDVGFGMSQPIIFQVNHSSEEVQYADRRYYVAYSDTDVSFPYHVKVDKKTSGSSWKNIHDLPFNPYLELVNPEETVLRETNRTSGKFRMAKINIHGETTAAIILDIVCNKITLLLHSGEEQQTLEIETMEVDDLISKGRIASVYQQICNQMNTQSNTMLEDIKLIIRNREIICNRLLAPSVREGLDKISLP